MSIALLVAISFLATRGIQECPDTEVFDTLPLGKASDLTHYYVKDGKNYEILSYNFFYVKLFCKVPVINVL